VASNSNTSPEILDRLAGDKQWLVRQDVAQNPNSQPETLARLADEYPYHVAKNPNTPQEALARLAVSGNHVISMTAKTNPNYSPTTTITLTKQQKEVLLQLIESLKTV
jgi:hypothetical protein